MPHVQMEVTSPFERCRRLVLDDPSLELRLRDLADWPGFSAALIGLAHEHGIELSVDDLEAERRQALLTWLARWA